MTGRALTLSEIEKALAATKLPPRTSYESWIKPFYYTLIKAVQNKLSSVSLMERNFDLRFDAVHNEYILAPETGFVPMARFRFDKILKEYQDGTV